MRSYWLDGVSAVRLQSPVECASLAPIASRRLMPSPRPFARRSSARVRASFRLKRLRAGARPGSFSSSMRGLPHSSPSQRTGRLRSSRRSRLTRRSRASRSTPARFGWPTMRPCLGCGGVSNATDARRGRVPRSSLRTASSSSNTRHRSWSAASTGGDWRGTPWRSAARRSARSLFSAPRWRSGERPRPRPVPGVTRSMPSRTSARWAGAGSSTRPIPLGPGSSPGRWRSSVGSRTVDCRPWSWLTMRTSPIRASSRCSSGSLAIGAEARFYASSPPGRTGSPRSSRTARSARWVSGSRTHSRSIPNAPSAWSCVRSKPQISPSSCASGHPGRPATSLTHSPAAPTGTRSCWSCCSVSRSWKTPRAAAAST